jgi:hypothetical protein
MSTPQSGRAHVRATLSMGTLVAVRHNPVLKAFYDRRGRAGKVKKDGQFKEFFDADTSRAKGTNGAAKQFPRWCVMKIDIEGAWQNKFHCPRAFKGPGV